MNILLTTYKASDYQTLVDGGFSEMYVDESNDTYYSQSELEEYKSKHPDTSVTIANSNSTAVDNFVSQSRPFYRGHTQSKVGHVI